MKVFLLALTIALIDGFYPWHADLMKAMLEHEHIPYNYYELDSEGEPVWTMALERELARARNNHEKTVVVEVCLTEYHSGIANEIKMLTESGAVVYLPACYAGMSIHPAYDEYAIVVGALDKNGNKPPELNNGPEVDAWAYGCWTGTCSTSEAVIKAAIQGVTE